MSREVFRKTPAGQAEVRGRALGLDARTRGLLILANGELTVEQLAQRVGFDPLRTIMALVGAGLLERVATAPRPRAPAAAPEVAPAVALEAAGPPPAPALPPAPARHALEPQDLAAARTRALTLLSPHYGPDALRMAGPLRGAVTPAEFARALDTLRETMTVHMGRKLAERLAQQIAHGT